jgi:hypothetical protein
MKRGGRFSGGLGVWVHSSVASHIKEWAASQNYGGSEGVQWLLYSRDGVQRAFLNVYRDSLYFREQQGHDEAAYWSGIRDDVQAIEARACDCWLLPPGLRPPLCFPSLFGLPLALWDPIECSLFFLFVDADATMSFVSKDRPFFAMLLFVSPPAIFFTFPPVGEITEVQMEGPPGFSGVPELTFELPFFLGFGCTFSLDVNNGKSV